MHVTVTDDLAAYAESTRAFLERDPVGNTVALSVRDLLLAGGGYDDDPPWFAWAAEDDAVVGAVFRTPPHLVGLAAMAPEAATALGAACPGRELPGVIGPEAVAAAFAAGAGRALDVRMRETLYALDELVPPPPVPGAARPYTPDDAAVYVPWTQAFFVETGLLVQSEPVRALDNRLRGGGALALWCVDGEPVAMAGRTPMVCGIPRVGPVWTVPEHRGRGYAAAVTAHICAEAFAAGATRCTLFADAANATSNGVYRRLGFREVGAVVEARLH